MTNPMLPWSSFTGLNNDSGQDDDKAQINPVMDWSAKPENFIFDDENGVGYYAGSGWLSGFLGVGDTSNQDAASFAVCR